MEILYYYSAIQSVNRLQKNLFHQNVYTVCLLSTWDFLSVCVYTVGHFLFTFFFYSLRLSLGSLTKEKGKRRKRADLLCCAVGFSVDTFVSLLWQKKRQKSWYTERDTSQLYILKRIPRFFSLIHPQKNRKRETIGR